MPGPLFPIQNFVAKPYKGSLQGVNVSLLSRGGVTTNDGQQIQPRVQSRCVSATIDFLSTPYTGQAVSINLQSSGNTPQIGTILMVYVDNELNSQNVTIGFPDTQQFLGIPAFTTGYYPVLTGQLQCTVYNGTTGKVPVTAASQVEVIFCNFAIPGFLSQETLDITVNSSNGPVVPVIGDQTIVAQLYGGGISANPETILPTLTAPQQYVITGIEINAQNLWTDGITPQGSTAPFTPAIYDLGICLGAPGNTNFTRQVNVQMNARFGNAGFFNLLDETGLNIPVQGMLFYTLQVLPGGFIFAQLPPWSIISCTLTYAQVTT